MTEFYDRTDFSGAKLYVSKSITKSLKRNIAFLVQVIMVSSVRQFNVLDSETEAAPPPLGLPKLREIEITNARATTAVEEKRYMCVRLKKRRGDIQTWQAPTTCESCLSAEERETSKTIVVTGITSGDWARF